MLEQVAVVRLAPDLPEQGARALNSPVESSAGNREPPGFGAIDLF